MKVILLFLILSFTSRAYAGEAPSPLTGSWQVRAVLEQNGDTAYSFYQLQSVIDRMLDEDRVYYQRMGWYFSEADSLASLKESRKLAKILFETTRIFGVDGSYTVETWVDIGELQEFTLSGTYRYDAEKNELMTIIQDRALSEKLEWLPDGRLLISDKVGGKRSVYERIK